MRLQILCRLVFGRKTVRVMGAQGSPWDLTASQHAQNCRSVDALLWLALAWCPQTTVATTKRYDDGHCGVDEVRLVQIQMRCANNCDIGGA